MSSQQAIIPAMAILPNTMYSTISDDKLGIAPVVATAIAVSGSDQVLVAIKNYPKHVDMRNVSAAPPYKQLFGFARVRAENSFIDLYNTISDDSDYRMECWDDLQYLLHLRPLVNEVEWMQLKKDILQIYSEQNAKRAALRNHKAFLEAVMTAHPDLDPVLVEEELIQQLKQLADNFPSRHPGVYCRFASILGYHETEEGRSYYETFQIQFLKFVPDFQV